MKSENYNDDFLKDVYPHLFENKILPDTTPPQGYFDHFPDAMMTKIISEANREAPKKHTRIINLQNLAIAAAFALILALTPYLKSIIQKNDVKIQTSVSQIEVTDEIWNNAKFINTLNSEDLYNEIAELDLEVFSDFNAYDPDEIIDYLLAEGHFEDLIEFY